MEKEIIDYEQTDYGQIDIYNECFKDADKSMINNTPEECIRQKLSYTTIYKEKILPVMIGSELSSDHTNPLKIKGYFIIKGLCYTVNNMFMKIKNHFSKDTARLSDGSKIVIKNLFEYHKYTNGKKNKWYFPSNWKDILKYTKHKQQLENHLSIVESVIFNKKKAPIISEPQDLFALAKMFECWLDLASSPKQQFRLITPGELFKDCISFNKNIEKSFLTSSWNVKYMWNVTSVSELMKHHNPIQDIESVRRISYPSDRENMRLIDRQVKLEHKNKICPVQSPDGKFCGTVFYLCKNAKITTIDIRLPDINSKGDIFMFCNGEYVDVVDKKYINNLPKNLDIDDSVEGAIYISSLKGRIIASDNVLSYTANLIPNILHNPPVRATFACSMIKQTIIQNHYYIGLINNTKTLINSDHLLGNTLKVAIMPWYGYNIEDSIVISESASLKYKYNKNFIYRTDNNIIINIKVKLGQKVNEGQHLFTLFKPKEIQKQEHIYSKTDGVITHIDENEFFITETKNLKVGDKMTSRHGQKGVISLIEKDDNMPRTSDGQIADIIINPHAFPSRMTMGQLVEMGNKTYTLYIKNKKINQQIYFGPCVYLALRHQVDEKLQYSNGNKKDPITLQPSKSLRFGQMERDILLALGAVNTLHELWDIDKTLAPKCPKSGIYFPNCCAENVAVHQYFIICLSFIRALGYDIRLKEKKYSILPLDKNIIPITKTKNFGESDPSMVRMYKDLTMLPNCLRSYELDKLYKKPVINITSVLKETRRLLQSKEGVFHKLFEGHNVKNCLRSVITPNPNLALDEVEVPIGTNLGTKYGILNRQPSLNISSLKIMKIKYKNEKTISFNPLLCASFNADFDGDEMNIYGIQKQESIDELIKLLPKTSYSTQDYILLDYLNLKSLGDLTHRGLTPDEEGMQIMIQSGSKGKEFNFRHIYKKIENVEYDHKEYYIKGNYNNGISIDDWYLLCMISRNNTASIAINTPVTGYLQSICNQLAL